MSPIYMYIYTLTHPTHTRICINELDGQDIDKTRETKNFDHQRNEYIHMSECVCV